MSERFGRVYDYARLRAVARSEYSYDAPFSIICFRSTYDDKTVYTCTPEHTEMFWRMCLSRDEGAPPPDELFVTEAQINDPEISMVIEAPPTLEEIEGNGNRLAAKLITGRGWWLNRRSAPV